MTHAVLGTPPMPFGVGGKLPLPLYADVRLHIPMTRHDDLGRGSFGTVLLVHDVEKNLNRAQKVSAGEATLEGANVHLREAQTMTQFRHPNTVRCIDSFMDQDEHTLFRVNIVMEYCAGGDLQKRIEHQVSGGGGGGDVTSLFAEADVAHVLLSCLKGLAYIHAQETVHRDIKPANIMLFTDGTIRDTAVKIADFGLAKHLELKSKAAITMSMKSVSGRAGTEVFMAPEVSRGQKYKATVDVWSLGVTAVYMMSLAKPTEMIDDAKKVGRLFASIPDAQYSPGLVGVCRLMLQMDASERPTAANLVHRLDSGLTFMETDQIAALLCPHLQPEPVHTASDVSTVGCLHQLLQQLKDASTDQRTQKILVRLFTKAADQAVVQIAAVPLSELNRVAALFQEDMHACIAEAAFKSTPTLQALHARLNAVKHILVHFAHTTLRFCTRPMVAADSATVLANLSKMVVEPAIQCMRDGIRRMQGEVRRSPDQYRLQLVALSQHDKAIYTAEFSKRTTSSKQSKREFESMCSATNALIKCVESSKLPKRVQPTGHILELVCICRDVVPQFEDVVARLLSGIGSIVIQFRTETKAMYVTNSPHPLRFLLTREH